MKPAPFAYFTPTTVDEVVALLAEYPDEAKVLAGSQSLVPLLNFRLARPEALVDINRVAELSYIREVDGGIAIGALTRQALALKSPILAERCPVLKEAIGLIGHAAIRHRGTVGGSVAHADPAAELPLMTMLLDARISARSVRGQKTYSASEFYFGYLTTALAPDELLTEVWFEALPQGAGWSVAELCRRHGDFALVSAASTMVLDSDGNVSSVRLALGGVAGTPVRATAVEAALVGRRPEAAVLEEVVQLVDESIEPADDVHAPAEYRSAMARVYARQVLSEAAARSRTELKV